MTESIIRQLRGWQWRPKEFGRWPQMLPYYRISQELKTFLNTHLGRQSPSRTGKGAEETEASSKR